jgi:SHS2 domain-containing protein
MPYEVLPHTADFLIRVTGKSLEEFLSSAVTGMFEAVKPDYAEGAERVERKFSLAADTPEALLVDLLNEAVSLSDAFHEAYEEVIFESVTEREAEGTLVGRPVKAFEVQIKAATHHHLAVTRFDGSWEATVTFDV